MGTFSFCLSSSLFFILLHLLTFELDCCPVGLWWKVKYKLLITFLLYEQEWRFVFKVGAHIFFIFVLYCFANTIRYDIHVLLMSVCCCKATLHRVMKCFPFFLINIRRDKYLDSWFYAVTINPDELVCVRAQGCVI